MDRIEIASALVSEGEFQAVKKIVNWARDHGLVDRLEILGFVDGERSLKWIQAAGAKVINLLCKGSEKHCKYCRRVDLLF